MSEKKLKIKHYLLIFFVIHLVLAFFLDTKIHIGRDEETGKFSVWTEKDAPSMQEVIGEDIQPDVFVEDNGITDPERFTYGSRALYDFFAKLPSLTGSTPILNFRLWRMLVYINIFLVLLALYVRSKLRFIPSRVQLVAEMAYSFLEDLVLETLGKKNKVFVAYFVTLFFFIWISNQSALLPIPGISEPTKNLNVPLGLGLMAVAVVHYNAIRKKGFKEWAGAFCEPLFFLLPLNLVGELSKIISISFRLFGNIFGGAIIGVVVSSLTKFIIVPVGLNMFFTLFAGTIQAFVFTMLAMTYLSLEIAD